MFNILIISYLFLGGAGSGTLIILSIFEFLCTVKSSSRLQHISNLARSFPSDFFSRAWSFCAVLIILGILCLLLDLGRIDRIIHLLFSLKFSALSIGSYSLLLALLCAGYFALTRLLDTISARFTVTRIVSIIGIISGIVAAVYTGILLQNMASVIVWNTPLLPVIFFLSSLSAGIACLFLTSVISDTRKPIAPSVIRLANVDGLIILIELICLFAFALFAWQDSRTLHTIEVLTAGELAWIFWGILVCGGLILPVVLERYLSPDNAQTQLLWISLFLLIGGFALRYCIVEIGQYDVTQTFEFINQFGREVL